ncbi:MAG: DNA-protecting protein DprA [Candidatus Magasanikbacteria bacterium]|nr:DNA-protecting protein DprA [Candidatus Magasanikbacteria bacterium]
MKKEILLSYFPKISYKRYQDILHSFPNLEQSWGAPLEEHLKRLIWPTETVLEFYYWKQKLEPAKIEATLKKENIYCVSIADPLYPTLLKHIPDPPVCLFSKGDLHIQAPPLAVVGTRKNSNYGARITKTLLGELFKEYRITLISGLAFGIDSIAHQVALDTKQKTIAVLGSGIDPKSLYPKAQAGLAENILRNEGAVISECPPGTEASLFSFPKRNRIIAGMSLGTLVIEAGKKSGALITADCALEYNREVFAVPQNIDSPSACGVNGLIKKGAVPILSAEDLAEALNLRKSTQYDNNHKDTGCSLMEKQVLELISHEPTHIDQIIRQSDETRGNINAALSILEINGLIRNVGSMMYELAS